ncbi:MULTISPECIES: PTS glucose transporter subunit IIA [unclassified Lactobacillus]|uniref:PTS glucose transporter subunit IIA n=1 Tax=unclassified Lactobacillus TaxID=2620435 RepID=UPI0011C342E9|nr:MULTISPECIES: PTS glucose transporter subunit IIA [unclassified Lactobacillus]
MKYFQKQMMCQGFAIESVNNDINSPIKGKIISIFNTKHAIGLETKSAEMDLNEVKHAGKSATVITVITNSDDKVANMEFKIFSGTTLKSHEEVGKVYLK